MKKSDRGVATEIIRLILKDSKAETIHGIYNRIAPGPDGRIRTVCSPVGTETGRFAHKDTFLEASTNLGNLPKKVAKLDPLFNVRECLVPEPGWVFLEADLSQAEVWTTAAYAGDTAKLEQLRQGVDLHTAMGAYIFDIPEGDVGYRERVIGKRANHMLNYGAGWNEFMSKVNVDADLTEVAISAAVAKKAVEGWRDLNQTTVRWWRRLWVRVKKRGQPLETCWGRRRYFLSPYLRPTDVAAYLPQSTVADCLNEGLCRFFYQHDQEDSCRLIHQIHDAVMLEVRENAVMGAVKTAKESLTIPMEISGFNITIPVDIAIGRESWANMEEL